MRSITYSDEILQLLLKAIAKFSLGPAAENSKGVYRLLQSL